MMRTLILAPLLLASLLALSGCSIGEPSAQSRFYVLSPLPEGTEPVEFEGEAPRVGLTRVEVPSSLDRPQMVLYTAPNEVQYSEFNRWSEPLAQGIGETVRRDLLILMGPGKVSAFPWMQPFPRDYNVQIIVQEFGPYLFRNEAVLRAVFRIEKQNTEKRFKRDTLYIGEVYYTQPIAGETHNYDDIVSALSNCLGRLSKDIATELEKLEAQAGQEDGSSSGNASESQSATTDDLSMSAGDDAAGSSSTAEDGGKGMLQSHYRNLSHE